jgi:hypothetical protein
MDRAAEKALVRKVGLYVGLKMGRFIRTENLLLFR